MQNQTARFEALESMVGNLEKQAKKLGMFSGLVSKVNATEEQVQAIASCQEDIQQDVASLLISSTVPVKLLQTLSSQLEQDIGQIHDTQNALFAQQQSVFADSFDELLKVHHTIIDGLRDDIGQLTSLPRHDTQESDQSTTLPDAAITALQDRIDALSQHLETLQTQNVDVLQTQLQQNLDTLKKQNLDTHKQNLDTHQNLDTLKTQNVDVLNQLQQTMDVLKHNMDVPEQLQQMMAVLKQNLDTHQNLDTLKTQNVDVLNQLQGHSKLLESIKTQLTPAQEAASTVTPSIDRESLSNLEGMITQLSKTQEQHTANTLTTLEQQLQNQQKEINSKLAALELALTAQAAEEKKEEKKDTQTNKEIEDTHTLAITEQLTSLHATVTAMAERSEQNVDVLNQKEIQDTHRLAITEQLTSLHAAVTAMVERSDKNMDVLNQLEQNMGVLNQLNQLAERSDGESQQREISDKLASLEAAITAQAQSQAQSQIQSQGIGQPQDNHSKEILEKLIALDVAMTLQREGQLQAALQASPSQELSEQVAVLKSTVTTQGQALTQILEMMQENQHSQLRNLTEALEKLDAKTAGLEAFNQELQGDRRKFLAMADAIDNLSSLRESARHAWCALGLVAAVSLIGYFV